MSSGPNNSDSRVRVCAGPCHLRTLNPRVRGSSPWRRTRTDLGFYRSRSFLCVRFVPMLAPRSLVSHDRVVAGASKPAQSAASRGRRAAAFTRPMVYTSAEHSIHRQLVQLRSVKCTGSSLLPECTRRAGACSAGNLCVCTHGGIGRSSEPGTAGPLRLHRRVRWAPPGCGRRRRAPAPLPSPGQVYSGPPEVHQGRPHTDRRYPNGPLCRPGRDRPARAPWRGWTALTFRGRMTPRILRGYHAVTGRTVHP